MAPKAMSMFAHDPGSFRLAELGELLASWDASNLPELHQCSPFCRGLKGGPPYHADWCGYRQVSWAKASAIAEEILKNPPLKPDGFTDPTQVLQQAVSLAAGDQPLGEAAASLINDAIELRKTQSTTIVDGGRHRIASILDQATSETQILVIDV